MLNSRGRRLYRLGSWWLLLCAAAFAFGEPLMIGGYANASASGALQAALGLPNTELYRALTLTLALWLAFAGVITLVLERQLLTEQSQCHAALANAILWLLALLILALVQPNDRAMLAALVATIIYGLSFWQLRFR